MAQARLSSPASPPTSPPAPRHSRGKRAQADLSTTAVTGVTGPPTTSGLPPLLEQPPLDATLALQIPVQPSTPGYSILYQGWLLKKRRKKLQGYARRYFVLRSTGHLVYSFTPGTEIRDQIFVPSAALVSTHGRRDIHIDSGRVTFHIKCLTTNDFQQWMGALRKFSMTGNEPEKTLGRRGTIPRGIEQSLAISKANSVAEDIGKTISDLVDALSPWEEDAYNGDMVNPTQVNPNQDKKRGSKSKIPEQHPAKDGPSILALFRKSSHQGQTPSRASVNSHNAPHLTSTYPNEKALVLLDTLREQHDQLTTALGRLSSLQLHSQRRSSPVQSRTSEDIATPTASSPALWQAVGGSNIRSSFSSAWSNTDGSSVWFDAIEGDELGVEEFIVQEHDEPEDDESVTGPVAIETELSNSLDKNEESEVEADISIDESLGPPDNSHLNVMRRTRLPAKPVGDEGSLFAVLKKNVGQDLSNIAFPVTFNEPLTLLQRSAEELEYYSLLDEAATSSDWIDRICHVAAFAVSGYACTKLRTGRKGFTPLLGETFEDIRMNFIAEKVVHKPLVIAYHAHGLGWELTATSSGKTKFWGKSFEIIPTGTTTLTIGDDVFEWNKPSSFTRNLMMGTKYLEHCGEMMIKNLTTGATCSLDFKETGYWGSTPNVVTGSVRSSKGDLVARLEGKWDEQMSQKLDSNHLRILWRIAPFPRNATEYYGYTHFGITLNEITPDIADKLPHTDSRFRPDVRALEEGDIERAEDEKQRIEQMQRERRQNGKEPQPCWFKRVENSDKWVYSGGYWESRRHGWKDVDVVRLW